MATLFDDIKDKLWELAAWNASTEQEEAFVGLCEEAAVEHLKGECQDCKDELCLRCMEQIVNHIKERQESQFDDQLEAEYDLLLEMLKEQGANN